MDHDIMLEETLGLAKKVAQLFPPRRVSVKQTCSILIKKIVDVLNLSSILVKHWRLFMKDINTMEKINEPNNVMLIHLFSQQKSVMNNMEFNMNNISLYIFLGNISWSSNVIYLFFNKMINKF